MSYKFVQKLVPENLWSLKAKYKMNPMYITIHETYNNAVALNEISFMTNNNTSTSFHVAIDDTLVVQGVPFDRTAFANGDGENGKGNRNSISVEICFSKSGGKRYNDSVRNSIVYVASLLHDFGWGIDRIKWHRDWSGKECPQRLIRDNKLAWYKQQVQKELNKMSNKPSEWAEASWKKAVENKIIDGTNPKGYLSREQMVVILDRVGLLDKKK